MLTGRTCHGFWLCLIISLLIASSCGGGGSSSPVLSPTADGGFSLEVLPDSYLGDAPSGEVYLAVDRRAATTTVTVHGSDLDGLRALYFQLDYEPVNFDPAGVQSGSGWQAALAEDSDAEPLEIEVFSEAGQVHYGLVLPYTGEQPGISGDAVLATVTFANQQFTPRTVSAPPVTDGSRAEARWDSASRTLSWGYDCQGDYNQDGLVTVTDLTPVGQHYDQTGPFEDGDALSVVDGNSDGAITVSDITPIGQNFGRGVEGYDIFASADPGDLPGGNDEEPTIDPVAHIPFADAYGNPQVQRLMFSAELPDLSGQDILWVRPVSEALSGTPSSGDVPVECEWVIRDVSAYASIQSDITYSSLAVIAGHPAVVYQSLDNPGLYYQRALDPTGYAWDDEVLVAPGGNEHRAVSLIEWEGRPALAHHDAEGAVEFLRATDETGAIWLEPVVIATTDDAGWDCHLAVVDGLPAVCYMDTANGSLMYARANTTTLDDWEDPTAIADLGGTAREGGGFSALAVIDGKPGVAYFNPTDQHLYYVGADDAAGSSWRAPYSVASGEDVGRWCSLAEVTGNPAITFEDDDGLSYIRASDPGGTEWGNPVLVDPDRGRGEHRDTSLLVINGRPAVSYYSGDVSADLMFALALDAEGDAWSTPQVVDRYLDVGRSTTMAIIDEHPCISYLDETNLQVRFAVCLPDGNLPPVGRFSISPNTVELSEQFSLDAAASYDPDDSITEYAWDLDQDGTFETSSGTEPVLEYSYGTAGTYRIALRVTDTDGAEGFTEEFVFVGDAADPPTAELTVDRADVEINESIHFFAADSAQTGGTIELYEWDFAGDGDFEMNTGAIPEIDYEYSTEGIYNAAVRVTASNGLVDIAQVCINVGLVNQRPIADVTAYPWWGNPPWTMYLDASGSYDPDGTIVKYEWDCDQDGYFEYDGGSTATYDWLCEQYGARRIKVRVTDNAGAQDTGWMLCSSNEKPVSKFSYTPTSGKAPLTVTCDGSPSYDPDGTITSYGWDLNNDGSYESSGTGPPGIYKPQLIWNGLVKIRLRVRDDMGGYADSVGTVQVSKGWHIRTLDPVGWTGLLNDLEVVNGAPAIAYYELYGRNLKFIRATDTYGYNAWNNPVVVGQIAMKGGLAYDIDLEVAGGNRPAIGFSGHLYNDPCYVIANDTGGTAWGGFVQAWPGGVCGTCELEMVQGKPMLSALILGARVAPAKDSLGSAWNKQITAAATPWFTAGHTIKLKVVNGNPALAYCDYLGTTPQTTGLKYVRATEPDGSAWGTPVWIDNKDDAGEGVHLAVINGFPAVAYVARSSSGGFEVRYKRALDANGSSWATAPVLVKTDGRDVLGLETVAGCPAIGLVTCQGHDVLYFKGADADGTSFPLVHVIDETDQNTGIGYMGGAMTTINGKPAVSYHHSVIRGLKYACWE